MLIGIDASRAQTSQKTGTENYSYNLIQNLARWDSKNNYILYQKLSEGFKNLPSNFQTKTISLPRLWTQAGLSWECFLNPPDVLFVPAHTLPVVRRPGLKTVVTVHDLGAEFLPEYHKFPQKLYLNKSTEYAVAHATHLIAVSENTKRDLVNKLGANPGKITVVYEGIDAKKFTSNNLQFTKSKTGNVKEKYDIEGEYLLFVGTIQPRKNLVRLIEAFSQIENFRPDVELILVGKPGWLAEEIYQAPKKFGVEAKVKFLNYLNDEDLAVLYVGALAFTFPSLYEGFGLPILEAMASGIPVVCSNSSSLPEVGGKAAIYVNPEETASIAGGLKEVLGKNKNERSEIIKRGFEQVNKFSWGKCARETLEVFEKVYGK